MRAGLLSLGFFLLCTIRAYAEVPIQPNFEEGKFTGTWYSIGLASNSKWFDHKKEHLKMCTTIITPTIDGNLNVTSTFSRDGQQKVKTKTLFRTEQPGRFRATSLRWGNEYDIRVVETNYDEYALTYKGKTKDTEIFTMVILYSRARNLRPELLEKFRQFSLDQGLAQSNILILPPSD
ncbi:lipocalin-like [Rhinatrema bivittatum]|uniref:lipocalin-like n=1 Tax=Rhinatrema bivittatum TaxID=194408 RepID=UPI00112B15CF|nr:lipocalin-like [Rhinatrema bivittatum]XP_029469950.1 lipocalin-like [Rhinatrema bivittatum]